MRFCIAVVSLLLCSPCSAAFISTIGGSWSDGTTTANYVEVPPINANDAQAFQVLLTVDDNSHVLSTVSIQHNSSWSSIITDTSIDFYDGMGDLGGEFEFDVLQPSYMGLSFANNNPIVPYLDGSAARGLRLVEPGTHVLSWQVPGVALNAAQEAWVSTRPVPEPGAVWLLLLGVPLWWWRRG